MNIGIVSTIGQNCRRCYSCVRECPANAIKVEEGQAVVIAERCISCGHCVKVCTQNAKKVSSDIEKVLYELLPNDNCIAVVAPSFAASFPKTYDKIPTALKKLGFTKVIETAFGADLISTKYSEYYSKNRGKTIISSPCPAIYNYIEKYYPELIDNLAPIVSPMVAAGRYLKNKYGNETPIVFIGPCIAKKNEYNDANTNEAIDSVLTFTELNKIFDLLNICLDELEDGNFDPPYSNLGKSFPLVGGLLKTANISSDILEKEVIIVDGKDKVKQIIRDIADNKIQSKFIDILFCEGCINGPAIESSLNYFSKREKVIEYFEKNIKNVDKNIWKSEIYNSRNLDLSRVFEANDKRRQMPSEERIREILRRTNKFDKSDELNCGACGYPTCRENAIAIAKGLAEEEMCLPYLIDKLETAYQELHDTKDQLHNSEKLASIGQLAAGVAHEINNPLGTIMLYSAMMKKELEKAKCANGTVEDLNLIIKEANRCKNIVANLLNFARQGKIKINQINLLSITKEIVRQQENAFNDVKINLKYSCDRILISADEDQIMQVILNLISNAVEAVETTKIKEVNITLTENTNDVTISVADSGIGIPEENMRKLFTPFFTTKKMGKGTGLGLAITYGIIKMHKGDIKVESEFGKGAEFIVKLPKNI